MNDLTKGERKGKRPPIYRVALAGIQAALLVFLNTRKYLNDVTRYTIHVISGTFRPGTVNTYFQLFGSVCAFRVAVARARGWCRFPVQSPNCSYSPVHPVKGLYSRHVENMLTPIFCSVSDGNAHPTLQSIKISSSHKISDQDLIRPTTQSTATQEKQKPGNTHMTFLCTCLRW